MEIHEKSYSSAMRMMTKQFDEELERTLKSNEAAIRRARHQSEWIKEALELSAPIIDRLMRELHRAARR
jgi:hypothetical protein